MFNYIRAVAASATLITVGTLALPSVALVRSEANLSVSNFDYGHEQTFTFPVNDRSQLSLPSTSSDLNQPVALMCYFC